MCYVLQICSKCVTNVLQMCSNCVPNELQMRMRSKQEERTVYRHKEHAYIKVVTDTRTTQTTRPDKQTV